jgi:putative chitinase
MTFDRAKFFKAYRETFGTPERPAKLKQSQVNGLETLLGFIETDATLHDIRHISYILATVRHETADTYQPIEEYGRGGGKPYGRAIKVKTNIGQKLVRYYGRGYVQLTWIENYRLMEKELQLAPGALVWFPEKAMEPETAYKILVVGMMRGLFNGKRLALGHYINRDKCDYRQARRTVNLLDDADLIAGHAIRFQKILTTALLP